MATSVQSGVRAISHGARGRRGVVMRAVRLRSGLLEGSRGRGRAGGGHISGGRSQVVGQVVAGQVAVTFLASGVTFPGEQGPPPKHLVRRGHLSRHLAMSPPSHAASPSSKRIARVHRPSYASREREPGALALTRARGAENLTGERLFARAQPARQKGSEGGKQPSGNATSRQPLLSFSAASRNLATNSW